MARGRAVGVNKMLIVGGYYDDALASWDIVKGDEQLYGTVGVHPCRANMVEE